MRCKPSLAVNNHTECCFALGGVPGVMFRDSRQLGIILTFKVMPFYGLNETQFRNLWSVIQPVYKILNNTKSSVFFDSFSATAVLSFLLFFPSFFSFFQRGRFA